METRDHLQRLPAGYYQGHAIVHWSLTIRDRRTGWLSVPFLYRFRELLTHSCLMPDHFHVVWMGLLPGSDQMLAMKHLRKAVNESLRRIAFELQDQSYDHVLKSEEQRDKAFHDLCDYIARNPERDGLVAMDGFSKYPFSGCVVPGYPELRPFEKDFRDHFDRVVSFLRKDGLMRIDS